MYGLILENIACYLKNKYGLEVYKEILFVADIQDISEFEHSKIYSETLPKRLVCAAQEVTNDSLERLMDSIGYAFCEFAARYGYDKIIRVLGRRFADFMNGLDNLHEYLHLTYPRLKPPSFYCESESRTGLTLHYRSKRKGFLHYVKGQILYICTTFYNMDVKLELLDHSHEQNMEHVIFRLHFNNADFDAAKRSLTADEDLIRTKIKITSDVFFDVFPFIIVFNRGLYIRNVGLALMRLMPSIIGRRINSEFVILKPSIRLRWEDLVWYLNNVFELMSINPIWKTDAETLLARNSDLTELENERRLLAEEEKTKYLTLKGQMIYMEEWESICFLGNPIVVDLQQMHKSGLFINDFAMHDSSRDLVLTGTLQAAELKLLLDQEAQKGSKLKESMKKLKAAREKADELLYQLFPKSVADILRKGASAVATCECFESVTMLFTDVVGFTKICSEITPMSVVNFLNNMYSVFDALTEKHGVFKVETIGDAYMIVGGAPIRNSYYPEYVCDCALSIMESVKTMVEVTSNTPIKIRAGVHTGNVVGGVVGLQMPRYCLFGENVTIANRMESKGSPMMIQVSQTTKDALEALNLTAFEFVFNTTETLPNKSQLKTYWLKSKNGPPRPAPEIEEEENFEDMELKDICDALPDEENSDPGSGSRYTPVSASTVDRLPRSSFTA